jgi:hypothetical protein
MKATGGIRGVGVPLSLIRKRRDRPLGLSTLKIGQG